MKRETRKIIIPSYIFLLLCAAIWASPIAIAITKSLQINGLENYKYVLTQDEINYFLVVGNSLIIGVATALCVAFVTSMAGFAFSKMRFWGKNILYVLILACLAVPATAVTMPMFNIIMDFDLLNTHLGVIWPLIAFNAPMMLLMTKNYFDGLPNELLEAARIDGASSLRIYSTIMVPLSKPVLANVLVLTFIYSWNDYFVPLLVMREDSMYTVTLAAQYFMSSTFQSPSDIARIYAIMLLLTLPSLIVYLFSQRYLQSGIVGGAVKG